MADDVIVRLILRDKGPFIAGVKLSGKELKELGNTATSSAARAQKAGFGMGVLKNGIMALGKAAKWGILGIGALGVAFAVFAGKKAMDAQKAIAQTNAVIASTRGIASVSAKHVDDLSRSIERNGAINHTMARSAENVLLTFTAIRNQAGKNNDIFDQTTTSVIDLSRALHLNLHNASIQVGKALNDPVKGALNLRRVGVSLTTAQQALIKSLVEHNHLLEAQKIILGELQTEFGGSEKAYSRTAAGSMQRFKNVLIDIGERAGKIALPAITRLFQFGGDLGERFARRLPSIQNRVEGFFNDMERRGKLIFAKGPSSITGGAEGWAAALIGVTGASNTLYRPLTKVIQAGFDLYHLIKDDIIPVAISVGRVALPVAIGALIAATNVLHWIVQNGGFVRAVLLGVVAGFVAFKTVVFVQTFIKNLRVAWAALNLTMEANPILIWVTVGIALGVILYQLYQRSRTFRNAIDTITRGWRTMAEGTIRMFRDLGHWSATAAHFVVDPWQHVVSFFQGIPDGISKAFSHLYDDIIGPFQRAWDWLKKTPFGGMLRSAVDLVHGDWKGAGRASAEGLSVFHLNDTPKMHSGGTTTSGGLVNLQPNEEIVVLPPAASVIPLGKPASFPAISGVGNNNGPHVARLYVNGKKIMDAVFESARDQAARR